MDTTHSLANLGVILGEQGRLKEAEDACRELLALEKRLQGEESIAVARALSNLGDTLTKQGKLPEGEAMLREALAMKKKVLKPENPSIAFTLNSLAELLRQIGKLEEAEALAREALALRKKVLGPEHVYVADLLNLLGQILQSKGALAEAEGMAREALDMRMKLPGQPRLFDAFQLLREVLQAQGKLREVENVFRAEAIQYRKGAEAHNVQALNALAWLLATCIVSELRDGPSAVAYAQEAVAATNRKDAGILDTLAAAYAEAGDFTNAVAAQKEALVLVQQEAQKAELISRLRLYESNTPYRDQGN
jgi:tetratricopeptide (TPR) repeat protein